MDIQSGVLLLTAILAIIQVVVVIVLLHTISEIQKDRTIATKAHDEMVGHVCEDRAKSTSQHQDTVAALKTERDAADERHEALVAEGRATRREMLRYRKDTVRAYLVFDQSHVSTVGLVACALNDEKAVGLPLHVFSALRKWCGPLARIYVPSVPWGRILNVGPAAGIGASVTFLMRGIQWVREGQETYQRGDLNAFPRTPRFNTFGLIPGCVRPGAEAKVPTLPLPIVSRMGDLIKRLDMLACLTCRDAYGNARTSYQEIRLHVSDELDVLPEPGAVWTKDDVKAHEDYGWTDEDVTEWTTRVGVPDTYAVEYLERHAKGLPPDSG